MWIESRQPLAASAPDLAATRVDGRLFRLTGAIGDRALARTRQTITVERNPHAGARAARIGDGELIVQDLVRSDPPAAPVLMLVVDGSARLADAADKLIAALDAMPLNARGRRHRRAEPMRRVALAPWSDSQKRPWCSCCAPHPSSADRTTRRRSPRRSARSSPSRKPPLLWVHGPQPVSFRGSATRLEQAAARLSRLPDVVLYTVEPGPNELLPDAPWAWGARSLPQTGTVDADLAGFFQRGTGPGGTARRARARRVRPRRGSPPGPSTSRGCGRAIACSS